MQSLSQTQPVAYIHNFVPVGEAVRYGSTVGYFAGVELEGLAEINTGVFVVIRNVGIVVGLLLVGGQ